MSFSPKSCPSTSCENQSEFGRRGFYRLKFSGQKIRRFQCRKCLKTFSSRTFRPIYRQKKPFLNAPIFDLITGGVTLRHAARILNTTYPTVYKKFCLLSDLATQQKVEHISKAQINFSVLQFDEMESIEHTKLKPLSICLLVTSDYKILSAEVARMPAKGHLAGISFRKYGKREDQRPKSLKEALSALNRSQTNLVKIIRSDAKPSYEKLAKTHFPKAKHEIFNRSRKAREKPYEAKSKKTFDPLFALNQRCAKLRADIRRLTRRSWCTTKDPKNLQGHLNLYLFANNGWKLSC